MSNSSGETPGSMITASDREFTAPQHREGFFARKMPRRRVLTTTATATTVVAGMTLGLTEGPKIAMAAALAKPRTQEFPPAPTITYGPEGQPVSGVASMTDENPVVNQAPGEGGDQLLTSAEQWISTQRITAKATLKDPITGLERDVVNVRTEDPSQEVTLNPQTKQALASWGAGTLGKHDKNGTLDLVFVKSIATSPYPDEGQWGDPTKNGMLLNRYRTSPSSQSIQFLVLLPPDYSIYPPDLQHTVRANIAGNFLNSGMLGGEPLRPLSSKEAAALQKLSEELDYRNLLDISPVQSTQ